MIHIMSQDQVRGCKVVRELKGRSNCVVGLKSPQIKGNMFMNTGSLVLYVMIAIVIIQALTMSLVACYIRRSLISKSGSAGDTDCGSDI